MQNSNSVCLDQTTIFHSTEATINRLYWRHDEFICKMNWISAYSLAELLGNEKPFWFIQETFFRPWTLTTLFLIFMHFLTMTYCLHWIQFRRRRNELSRARKLLWQRVTTTSWEVSLCLVLLVVSHPTHLALVSHFTPWLSKKRSKMREIFTQWKTRTFSLIFVRRSSSIYVFRRACIRRSGSCDHRPNGCCQNSACRCNLWGSNCRCQRQGLFQKWGK